MVDQGSGEGDGAGHGAEDDEDVGVEFADLIDDFVVGDASAGEIDLEAVGFEEVAGHLGAELFGLLGAADQEDFLAQALGLFEAWLHLIHQGAEESGGVVMGQLGQLVGPVEGLEVGEGGPEEFFVQLWGRLALPALLEDNFTSDDAVAANQSSEEVFAKDISAHA